MASFLLAAPASAGSSGTVTSGFGQRSDPFHRGMRAHKGMDIAAAFGTPVVATGDGWIEFAGWKGSYGVLVIIRHASGYETRFAHLSSVMVRPGEAIRKGQPIGRVGSTGRSTGNHLHYEVRYRGVALNPAGFM